MPRRCPPGVFCIENMTIMMIFVCILLVIGYMYFNRPAVVIMQGPNPNGNMCNNNTYGNGNTYGNKNGDVFLDPYKAPLRDDNCFAGGGGGDLRGGIPINISTQGCNDAKYRQVGILTRLNGKDETILPLMGRPLFTRRDKWNFYTMNDKNNMIKLPITFKGRSCTDEYGCDNMYNGDTVFVEGYNDAFKVTTYDNQIMRYLPNL
jgi:hypothetical protein